MICPVCEKEMVYNAILRLYYCKEHHFYYRQTKEGKLKLFNRWDFRRNGI